MLSRKYGRPVVSWGRPANGGTAGFIARGAVPGTVVIDPPGINHVEGNRYLRIHDFCRARSVADVTTDRNSNVAIYIALLRRRSSTFSGLNPRSSRSISVVCSPSLGGPRRMGGAAPFRLAAGPGYVSRYSLSKRT